MVCSSKTMVPTYKHYYPKDQSRLFTIVKPQISYSFLLHVISMTLEIVYKNYASKLIPQPYYHSRNSLLLEFTILEKDLFIINTHYRQLNIWKGNISPASNSKYVCLLNVM